jgi:tRNA pseudouridine32 synthase/23S rRNA pseudouridine746 synthase
MDNCFFEFDNSIDVPGLPESINFPFYYEPHPIAKIAAEEVQNELIHQDFNHNFGLSKNSLGNPIGKMFGVLVVLNENGKLGYLKAFSGKLGDCNHHKGFVPPVFDILSENSFFKKEEKLLNALNLKIEQLETHADLYEIRQQLLTLEETFNETLNQFKETIRINKVNRAAIRQELLIQSDLNSPNALNDLNEQSRQEQLELKRLKMVFKIQKTEVEERLKVRTNVIDRLKNERKERSAALQKKLFDAYYFLNALGKKRSLLSIFSDRSDPIPPAGAGECAAPKLFQYAFLNNYKPIAMAEFWWGASPLSEIRKHGQYYPACRGKCEPILNHMLNGLIVESSPFLQQQENYPLIEILYEDEDIIVLNKPHEFLSVPGKISQFSVYNYIKLKYPKATGPLIVHRLDMSTSGIIILALNKDAHKNLQSQFLKHKIQKKYIAILDGKLDRESGIIDLPLRLDINDRPHQMVCHEHGKPSITKFEVLQKSANETRISFIPITGRTHQLRVHAAHVNGLNMPIKGDDLYGVKSNRLYLHAAEITFQHPKNKTPMHFQCNPEF